MKLRPLLRRTTMLPGESLASLMERLARLNYRHANALHRLLLKARQAGLPVTTRLAQASWQAGTFEQLSFLSGLPALALYSASVHHFAPLLTPPSTTPETTTFQSGETAALMLESFANKKLRPASAAQFCPRCLAESGYHRLAWTPVLSAACLRHDCLLVDQCPHCQRTVNVESIVQGRCRYCAAPFASAPVVELGKDELGRFSQAMLQAWLPVTPMPAQPWPFALPDQPPASKFLINEEVVAGRQSLFSGPVKKSA